MTNERPKQMLTPKYRVSYPYVFSPAVDKENGKETYSIQMLFDKKADLTEIKNEVRRLAVEAFGDKAKNAHFPFSDGNEKYNEDPKKYAAYKDVIAVRASSKFQPGVVDGKCVEIISPNEFYAGCYARGKVSGYAWKFMGKYGVKLNLHNLQKMNDGEALAASGRNPADDFDAVESDDSGSVPDSGADLFSSSDKKVDFEL